MTLKLEPVHHNSPIFPPRVFLNRNGPVSFAKFRRNSDLVLSFEGRALKSGKPMLLLTMIWTVLLVIGVTYSLMMRTEAKLANF